MRIPFTAHCVPLGALIFNQIPCRKWVGGENICEVPLASRRGKSWLLHNGFTRPAQKQVNQVGAWVSSHLPPLCDLGESPLSISSNTAAMPPGAVVGELLANAKCLARGRHSGLAFLSTWTVNT